MLTELPQPLHNNETFKKSKDLIQAIPLLGLSGLPLEIGLMIFSYLSHTELATASLVSRLFRSLAFHPSHYASLSFCDDFRLTSAQLALILTRSSDALIHLNIRNCPNVRDDWLIDPTPINTNLRHLLLHEMPHLNATTQMCTYIMRCAALESVAIFHCYGLLQDVFLSKIGSTRLRQLTIEMAFDLTDDGIRFILAGHRYILEDLSFINCPQLTSLAFKKSTEEEVDTVQISLNELTHPLSILHFPRLRCLNLSKCRRVSDDVLLVIAQSAPALESLNLAECTLMTNEGLAYLAPLMFVHESVAGLRELNIEGCALIKDEGILALGLASGHVPLSLREFHISLLPFVTDTSLIWLAKHAPGLTCVWMESCSGCSVRGLNTFETAWREKFGSKHPMPHFYR